MLALPYFQHNIKIVYLIILNICTNKDTTCQVNLVTVALLSVKSSFFLVSEVGKIWCRAGGVGKHIFIFDEEGWMIHEVDEYFSCSCIRRATIIINEASFVLFVMSCDVWPGDADQVPVYTALLPNHISKPGNYNCRSSLSAGSCIWACALRFADNTY